MNNFSTLGLSSPLLKALPELGIETPTTIQQKSIPILLSEKRDFIGLAQTGTGKTGAFGLPLIDLIDSNKSATQALVLAPTRELGQQIAVQLNAFARYTEAIRIQAVYGGAPIVPQIKALKDNPQIIIATPGRLIDLIKRKAVRLESVKYLVLDEADEMLNMGFQEDIDHILSYTPEDKSTWLFSATMPREIRNITTQYMVNPAEVSVNSENTVNQNIVHRYSVVKGADKKEALKRIVDSNPDFIGLVFCRTKRDTQELSDALAKDGFKAEALHGDLSQGQRDKVMRRFKAHTLKLLIATDVAARGIDVNSLSHVVHYALPDDAEYYTHRSGRTARAGKKGISQALITSRELNRLQYFERKLKISFTKTEIPQVGQIQKSRMVQWASLVAGTEVPQSVNSELLNEVQSIFDGLSRQELISKLMMGELEKLGYDEQERDLNDIQQSKKPKRDDKFNQRFFINVGRMDQVSKGELLQFICEHAELSKEHIGEIRLEKAGTYFDVAKQKAGRVTKCFKGMSVNGRKLRVSLEEGKSNGKANHRKVNKKRNRKRHQWV